MEIQSLRVLVTDVDLSALIIRNLPPDESIEELQGRITPEGVIVSGKYPTPFFKVSFETTWVPEPAGPEVRVRLATVKVAGLPATLLRGAMMRMILDTVTGKPGFRVEEESVVIHVPELIRAEGLELAVVFTEIRLSVGVAMIEACGQP